jgi:tetratricopeptide (TPR) repeat protein
MIMEFLFSAAIGSGITYKLLKTMNKVELDNMEKKYQQACDYHLQGNYKQAISILEDLIKVERLDTRYYIQLWSSYGKLSTIEDTKENIEKALECYEIIMHLIRQGTFVPQDILDSLNKGSELMREYHNQLSCAKVKRQEQYQEYYIDDQGDAYVRGAFQAMKEEKFTEVIQNSTLALELKPGTKLRGTLYVMRAMSKAYLGDDVGTIQDFKEALKLESMNDEFKKIAQTSISALQNIDKQWRRELSKQKRAIKSKLDSLDSQEQFCELCGKSKDTLVVEKVAICNNCLNKWRDKKSERVKLCARTQFG